MRRVLQALEQRAITATKVEVDSLISEASQSIEAYVEDNSNLTELKRSIKYLNTASNTLQIMQIHGGVLLADETVKVIRMLVDGTAARVEESQDVVSRAIMRLSEYLGHVEAGNKDVPLVLMPLLNDLRASRDAALLSENVLFFPNVDGVTVPQAMLQNTEVVDGNWLRVIRTNFQKTLLACVSGKDVATAAAQLCKLSIRLQRASKSVAGQKIWWLASALSQSVAINALPFNASIASLFNKLDKQIKLLIEVGEDEFANSFDESIIKNILYYIAISDDRGRIVNQVKESYRLNEQVPQQHDMAEIRQQLSAPSSEVLITVSKALLEDVASAKDCIELFIHSNLEEQKHIDRLYSGLQRISDTLSMIGIEEYRSKAEHQINEVELLKSGDQADVELILLGVSEVVLEIETCINNFIEYRINFQESADSKKDNNLRFDANYYDNEHKAAFSVTISEVLLRIEQTKEMLTDVVHISYDKDKVDRCVQNIKEISGVISVIDLASPIELIEGIATYIASESFERDISEENDALKDLADCLVGLQCYFEQLESRVPYAEQILEHCEVALKRISQQENSKSEFEMEVAANQEANNVDNDANVDIDFDATMMASHSELELNMDVPVQGSEEQIDKQEEIDELPDLNDFTDELVDTEDDDLKKIAFDQALSSDDLLAVQGQESAAELNGQDRQEKTTDTQSENVKSRFAVLTGEADPLLVETFIEEAEQVVVEIKNHWNAWKAGQKDWDSFANMRRGYHTLKGSGRFVGAELLSELSWQYENLCNKCLGKKEPIDDSKQALFQQGVECIPLLVEQLKFPTEANNIDVVSLIDEIKVKASDSIEVDHVIPNKTNDLQADVELESSQKLQDELTGIFTEEATQHIKVMRDAVGEENQQSNDIRIDDELLRTVHTMRGSARTAGVQHISDLCKPLEEIISVAIKNDIDFTDEQTLLVQSCVKQIESDLGKIEKSEQIVDLDSGLLNRLQIFNKELLSKYAQDDIHSQEHAKSEFSQSQKNISSPSMVDSSTGRDEELCAIFFEEAEDVLSECQGSLLKFKADNNDGDAISELQRQFHTLKGSSRMAGFTTIGELSHVTESLLLALSDNNSDAERSITILQRVLDTLHANIETAQREQDIYLDDALIAELQLTSGVQQETKRVAGESEISSQGTIEQLADELELNDKDLQKDNSEDDNSNHVEENAVEQRKPALKKFINIDENAEETSKTQEKHEIVRVPADVLDALVNDAGEVNIQRSRLEQVFNLFTANTSEFEQTIGRLREQLRKLEMETEAQILFKHADDQENLPDFDPLELDRYSDIQQLSRSLAESVDDLRNIKEMFVNHMQDGETVLINQKVVTTNLQDNLLHTRMIRFDTVEQRLQRIIRQTSNELNKEVDLIIQGGDIEVDRRVLNGVITSIEHILRNSVGHGIETPEDRVKNNKPGRGQIKIDLEREGSEISITIKDDGAGIDPVKVKAKAIENNLIKSDSHLTKEEILQLIFKPGLSTASAVSKIAGRGVGMDIVDKDIRRLGGRIETRSELSKGAKFILRLPFTLAVSHALLLKAGKEVYALTLSGVEGVIQLPVSELKTIFSASEPSYTYAGHEYSFHHLASLLQGSALYFEDENASHPVILVRMGEHRLAIHVEATYGNKEIVVKPLASHFSQSQGISGATILGDGSVALILDIPWIARLIQTRTNSDAVVVSEVPEKDSDEEATVMVVDDSITIRKVTTRFLERNNYKVVTAKDGVDALQKMQKIVPDVVLLDIEMPRMDGYELAAQMRKEERLANIPIIMITSRTGDKHRNRAMELGVNCYLGKPYNEAQLLERIERF
ncbi:MAG: Hpt domain-containing protein [Gammaproteobacteria bacterium]|nr:Hpt domain-containing protein [Gammaproteobacteria bacterium]